MEETNVASSGLEQTLRQDQEQPEDRRLAEARLGRQIYKHPEGKVARPHRCNDRLEDLIQALFEGDPRKNLPGPWRLLWQCIRSNPGEEPTEPFSFLKIDPPGKGDSKEGDK
ncbi:hypothetical protein Mp_3g22380 [Marchantia polymorpha subsp. ruderalis]|uniref:Uncharacterized protein n=2 Tax=Marchantia polymorpha TaxID=3197 RepID=A0AAF6B3J8_MARPO|nr:hypothetical protein MARPO_0024s0016 [Marchantia polymorpha]BBN06582.1 hypothetical protein Mp_3g22380 [Marchantia polymorpha subsp. ruderalis]|eukprot:PTQ43482.1 hypothetical protein MARPO_0024s0016 [Marchantia polymorpha]